MEHIKGPDFPTGGMILGTSGIRDAYETGRGRVRVQARAHIEPLTQGKEAIIVTELPYMVKKGGDGGLISKIADLVHEKKITEISDLRDESDRNGMRLVIELKRDAIPKVVLNKLYKHTPMQTTFGVNMVALVDDVPRTLSLREVIEALRRPPARGHRPPDEVRAAPAPRRRAHILEGLLIALDNLDEVIELIRASRDPRRRARRPDRALRAVSAIQAQAILDLRLQRLTALEARQDPGTSTPTSSSGSTSCARSSATRRGCWRIIKEELQEISDTLRRRAPHRDHRRRGRHRHRGPDRRPADGHHDHEVAATSSRCRSRPTASSSRGGGGRDRAWT